MTSHHHLQQNLESLGYCTSPSPFPEIPLSCIPLISVLVDDLLHSRAKVTKLEKQVNEANDKVKELTMQLASTEIMARKVGDDNSRLRELLRDVEWKMENIIELEYIVNEYKGHPP